MPKTFTSVPWSSSGRYTLERSTVLLSSENSTPSTVVDAFCLRRVGKCKFELGDRRTSSGKKVVRSTPNKGSEQPQGRLVKISLTSLFFLLRSATTTEYPGISFREYPRPDRHLGTEVPMDCLSWPVFLRPKTGPRVLVDWNPTGQSMKWGEESRNLEEWTSQTDSDSSSSC